MVYGPLVFGGLYFLTFRIFSSVALKNYYFILGLNIYATDAEIKRAYRKLALQFHPDKNSSEEAEAIFKEINEAYKLLSDSGRKFTYDQLLRGVSPAAPTENRPHRDPRYRPRPPGSYSTKTKRQELLEVMEEYLKYAILISRIALAFSIMLFIDYSLPRQITEQEVVSNRTKNEYRSGRSIQLEFDDGETLTINRQMESEFTRGSKLLIYRTVIFDVPVMLENEQSHVTTYIPVSVYGNFIFAPILMLITAVIGSFYWKGIEFRFNLGVVNFILMLLLLLFLRIHVL
jgi:curved DNA-binding protein CbpA